MKHPPAVPMHKLRPNRRQVRRANTVPVSVTQPAAPSYPAGHFLALVRRYDWSPRFAPQLKSTREVEQSESARINRERRQAMGDTGTIVGLTRRADALIEQRLFKRVW